MDLDEFREALDFEEFTYFYHETGSGVGDMIMDGGLLIEGSEGSNILGTKNILETTSLPFTKEIAGTTEKLIDFIELEKSSSSFRDVSEMVIFGAPKGNVPNLVEHFGEYKDGVYYMGRVDSSYILGYIDMENQEFIANPNYEYGDSTFIGGSHK